MRGDVDSYYTTSNAQNLTHHNQEVFSSGEGAG